MSGSWFDAFRYETYENSLYGDKRDVEPVWEQGLFAFFRLDQARVALTEFLDTEDPDCLDNLKSLLLEPCGTKVVWDEVSDPQT